MDYSTPFSFVTRDKDWIGKVAIGSLLVFTGIGAIAVVGWQLEIMRRVIRNDEQLLPDWNNFGQYLVDGLKLLAIGLVWALPVILLIGCFAGAAAVFSDESADEATWGLLGTCIGLIALGYSLILALLAPAAWGRLADTGSFSEALNPAKAWALAGPNLGDFLVAGLLGWLASGALAIVGTLLCIIGVFPATVYAYAIYGHLWGQLYRKSRPATPPTMPAEGAAM